MKTAILSALLLALGCAGQGDTSPAPVALSAASSLPECAGANGTAFWDLGQVDAAPGAARIEMFVCQWMCVPYAHEGDRVVTVRFLNLGDGSWQNVGVLLAPCAGAE